MSEITLVQEPPRPFVGIRRTVHHTKLGGYFAEVLPRVLGWAAGKGVASPPIAVWHAMDPKTGDCDAQAGCFVASAVEGEGEITPGETPGGDTLVLLHVGSYDDMGRSWGRVFERARELGREPGLGWEIYLDDPQQVAPEQLRTEIHLSLA